MSRVLTKEIIAYGSYDNLEEKVNDFFKNLKEDVEIYDIKYSTTSHLVNVVVQEDEREIEETKKDYILVRSVFITYFTG